MVLPFHQRAAFQKFLSDGSVPHLLFFGPPGSGKTTLAFILMDKVPSQRLVLNASSEDRGIATVKGKIKYFAGSMPQPGKLKIVFLDEADQLTGDAQKALRNTIETFSDTCRFILTANEVDKINPAIQSRCMRLEFNAYPKKRVLDTLKQILWNEKVTATPEDLNLLVDRFYPDMRTILNTLQSCSARGKFEITASQALSIDLTKLEKAVTGGNVRELRSIYLGVTDFIFLFRYLFDVFIFTLDLKDRPDFALTVSEYAYRDSLVVDKEMNFTACCVAVMVMLKVDMKW